MKTSWSVVPGMLVLAVLGLTAVSPAVPDSKLERGRYLVEQVALCGDCHTPHNEKGAPIREKLLQGALLPFKPIAPMPWADKAPNIAGLPGWEDKDAVKLLMTGLAYNDLPGRPPMPQYRFSEEDATAVVAYLRSLAPAGKARK
jgi:mono/diheme cytochrome c family protein